MVNEATNPPDPPTFVLFGIPFHDVTFEEAVAWAVARMKSGKPSFIATANVDFLMQAWRDPELHRILLEADLVIADGAPIVWASRLFGPRLRERVTGSDITPMLATACARENLRVFLLGGGPGVAEKAAQVLCGRNSGLAIAGTYSPPLAGVLDMNHDEIVRRLNEAKPHLLLVAFGAPKQEKFINLNLRKWNVPLAIGIGGTLDFLAGVQHRAPPVVQKIGMEWLWRMLTNPKRLFARYAGNLAFMYSSLRRLLALRSRTGNITDVPLPDVNYADLGAQTLAIEDLSLLPRKSRERLHLLVNLRGRGWLDSRALGELLAAARALRGIGRRLLLVRPAPELTEFLRACRLDAYFEICADGADAVTKLGDWCDSVRTGAITSGDGTLKLLLPAELTSASVAAWAARVNAESPDTKKQIDVDAAVLEFLDSAGIGWLVNLRKRCESSGAKLSFRGFRGAALQTLQIARVAAFFQ